MYSASNFNKFLTLQGKVCNYDLYDDTNHFLKLLFLWFKSIFFDGLIFWQKCLLPGYKIKLNLMYVASSFNKLPVFGEKNSTIVSFMTIKTIWRNCYFVCFLFNFMMCVWCDTVHFCRIRSDVSLRIHIFLTYSSYIQKYFQSGMINYYLTENFKLMK